MEAQIQALSLADQAYQHILELISTREVVEGQLISHRVLARQLKMSKLPVSLALNRLQREGVVRSVPRVGTVLERIHADAIWELLQWRIALECQVARLAAEWMTGPDRDRLAQEAQKADCELTSRQADVAFHLLLADLSKARKLRIELERLDIYHLKIGLCEVVHAAVQPPPRPAPRHVVLAKAIAAGAPDEAERVMRDHLENNEAVFGFMQWYRRTRLKPTGRSAD